jgi:hypothetical protein
MDMKLKSKKQKRTKPPAIYTKRIVLMVTPKMDEDLKGLAEVKNGVSVARVLRDLIQKHLN